MSIMQYNGSALVAMKVSVFIITSPTTLPTAPTVPTVPPSQHNTHDIKHTHTHTQGADSVAIACDRRFGVQQSTIGLKNNRVFKIHNKCYIGLSGLMTDVQTVAAILEFRHNLYKLREGRNMNVKTFTKVVSNLLYSKRFGPYFVEPIIVGLDSDKDDEPFVSSMDLIGATEVCDNFACVGTTEDELYGMCENLWNKDMVCIFFLFSFCFFV